MAYHSSGSDLYSNRPLFSASNSSWYKFQNDLPALRRNKDTRSFDLQVPIQHAFKRSKNRVVIVAGHNPTPDLRIRNLFRSGVSITLGNVMELAQNYAVKFGAEDFRAKDWAFAAVNFNTHKTYHLDDTAYATYNRVFAKRVRDFIEKVDATHVLILGSLQAQVLLDIPSWEAQFKRGWVYDTKIGKKKVKVVHTVEFAHMGGGEDLTMSQKELDKAVGIFGYAARNIASLFLGHLPFSIAHIQPNPVYIKSIDAFDRMMEKLNSAQVIAVDSETESANKIANKLLMVQFATSSKKGYVLPLYHKDTPFSASQLKYIEGKLREFFMQKPGPDRYLIGQNFKFDIQQFTQQLGIPYFYWEFWDLMAGEFVYDENLGAVAKYSLQGKKGHYGLDSMTCHYGNDWYFKAPFSKDERATISSVKLDRNVLNYGAMDVQVPFAIHKMQIKKASLESFKKRDNSYGPVYSRFVRKQMANNIFMFAHMEHTGVPADLKWLMQLKSKTGPIRQVLNETLKDFYKYKAVQKANALLIKKSKIPQKGLWGQTVSWVFSLTKPEHKALLFFKVLDLEPVNESAKTGKPSVDKDFQKVHAEVPEVATFTRISKLEKLVSSFVTPFLNTITKDKDGKVDGRIRPEFGFIKVVTGRSNSSKPNFQQIPSRSKEAKLIKRIFIAPRGKLIIKMDFMAHEVRLWSHVSLDEVLAELFRVGREIRKKLFRTNHQTHPDILAKLRKNAKVQGDIHIQNVKYFFNKDVDKDHPLRDAIKAIIFGVIYGMHFRTLAEGIGKTPAFAEELMNKLFNRFKKAKRWLDYMKSFAAKNLYSYSPLGRCRHLYGYLLGNLAADRAMDRRADNAPIQGLGADDGHTGARLFLQNCYEFLLKTGRMKPEDRKMPIAVRTMVHDAIFSEANYRNVFASLHLLHHSCTNGLMDYYAKHFGVEYPVTTEIEIEIGVDESRLYKWDFSQEGLVDIIEKALADIPSLYPEEDVDEARRLIYKDMNNDKIKAYLARKYTILDGADYEGIDYEKLLAQVQKRNKIALKEAA